MTRASFLCAAGATCLLQRSGPARASEAPGDPATPRPDPALDRLFARAKLAWRERVDPPFVRYTLTESYEWRFRRQEHRWIATLRTSDGRLSLVRDAEAARASADAFTILDPPIVATESFGFVDARRALPAPAPGSGTASRPGRLNEIARTEAFVRDYVMESVGVEELDGIAVQHVLLVPRRDPERYRLRDLWIGVIDDRTVQLSAQGLFADPPWDQARWLVRYQTIDGRQYVRRVFNVDDLAIDGQWVRALSFECGDYDFPATVPPDLFA